MAIHPFDETLNTRIMFSIVKNWFEKLVLWIDWPPPKPRPGIKYVWWEFPGDLLDDLSMLSDRETGEFKNRDFSDADNIRELVREWILPDFHRYTPTSQRKIRDSLTYYLATRSEKLEWVFPSFNIPVRILSAHQFYSLVWECLYGEPVPASIDLRQYEECPHLSFINSLEKTLAPDQAGNGEYPYPERKGLILPSRLDRHNTDIPLEAFQKWATQGVSPDMMESLPCDAARWTVNADPDYLRQSACAAYQKRREMGIHVSRLTLHFNQTVGEGYLKGNPDKLLKTNKARFHFDKLGLLLIGYPLLR